MPEGPLHVIFPFFVVVKQSFPVCGDFGCWLAGWLASWLVGWLFPSALRCRYPTAQIALAICCLGPGKKRERIIGLGAKCGKRKSKIAKNFQVPGPKKSEVKKHEGKHEVKEKVHYYISFRMKVMVKIMSNLDLEQHLTVDEQLY